MKKIILTTLFITLSLTACVKEVEKPIVSAPELYASIEDRNSTKTYLDDENNIRWSSGDQILAFMKSSLGLKYQLKDAYIGKTSGYFSKVASSSNDLGSGMELDHNVAYYPYGEQVTVEMLNSNYIFDTTLPTEQHYVPDSFGNREFPMVAVSEDNDISFKNLCGGIKLQFLGTLNIASLKIEGKNNEKLSGPASVTAYTDNETMPSITMAQTASESVTLNCSGGVQLNEETITEFIIVLPPVTFSHGFTITITDTDNNEQIVETDLENTVYRSKLLTMPEITIETPEVDEPENTEPREGDYVDEYGKNHGRGIVVNDMVWAPVNCGYHETDHPHGKLYQWGRKYGQGYDNSELTFVEGPVDQSYGSDPDKKDEFYYTTYVSLWGWATSFSNPNRWNWGVSDLNPGKSDHDPCPNGWRVPTKYELADLVQNWSDKEELNGITGKYFSGSLTYSESVPRVFLPAGGRRCGTNNYNKVENLGNVLCYATSAKPDNNTYILHISASYSSGTRISNGNIEDGTSVRCIRIEPATDEEKGGI